MIQIALSLYFIYTFWDAAATSGRNRLVWATLGVSSFLIPSFAITMLAPRLLYRKVMSYGGTMGYDPSIIVGIDIGPAAGFGVHFLVIGISLYVGALSARFVRRRYFGF